MRCDDCECQLPQVFFAEARQLFLPQKEGFWHFQGTQSKGYLPAVAGLLAWVVL